MLKSVFRKWLFASMVISFAILFIVTASISWIVQKDFYRQGLQQLNDQSFVVEHSFLQLSEGGMTPAEFRKELKRIEREHLVQISIVGKRVKFFRQDLYDVGIRPDIKSWVTSVSEGSRIEVKAKFRKQDDSKMLIVGFPLIQNDQVVASAFMYKPVSDAKKLASPVLRSVWVVALSCAGPLILLLWMATRKFVRPVRMMDNAASSISKGDFSVRVQTEGVDEIARLGTSFNLMAERIERIEEQRGRLITEITHELRTPLTSIRGTLQALEDGILSDQEQQEFISLSLAEAERLGGLIDSIHELSAFEEHRIKLDFKRIDLTELAEQTVQQLSIRAEALEIGLNLETGKGEHIFLIADPMRIRQVLINLIGNALDHNPRGTIVKVKVAGQRHKVSMIVEDNGGGIAPEHLPRLFDRLYKAESSRASKGSGLGLTISRHIVHGHKGTIEVWSEPGRGTIFKVELPSSQA